MADLSSVTDNYLPTASETFTDNLSSSIAALATTVPVNSAVEYADGDTVVLTVDPGTANEATFVGKKDAGMNQFIECIWTEGNTAVGHDAGATIIDYDSATHFNLLSTALQGIMGQDGVLLDDLITNDMLKTGAGQPGGAWTSWTPTLTNHTASSVIGGYMQIGKTVHFYLRVVLNAAPTAGLLFSAPVTMHSRYENDVEFESTLGMYDSGTRRWSGVLTRGTTADDIELKTFQVSGTGVYQTQATPTVPFTMASGDAYYASGTYEAA